MNVTTFIAGEDSENRAQAWEFMRECEASGISAGYPEKAKEGGVWTVKHLDPEAYRKLAAALPSMEDWRKAWRTWS